MQEFSNATLKRINQGKEQIKDFLKKKVILKMEEALRQEDTHPERVILEEMGVTMIALTNFRVYDELDEYQITYSRQYKLIVDNLYQTSPQLQELSYYDLRVYLVLLYAKNLDKFSKQQKLPPSLEGIREMKKEELLIEIQGQKNN